MKTSNQLEKLLVGTWVLKEYKIVDSTFESAARRLRIEGLLIYSQDGYMAASLMEKRGKASSSAPKHLFYSGTFYVEKNAIYHCVRLASQKKNIGKTLKRDLVLQDHILELHTPKIRGCIHKLIWTKVRARSH